MGPATGGRSWLDSSRSLPSVPGDPARFCGGHQIDATETGQFFTDLTAPGLTGLLAVIAALLIVGGFVTMRRVRV